MPECPARFAGRDEAMSIKRGRLGQFLEELQSMGDGDLFCAEHDDDGCTHDPPTCHAGEPAGR